MPKDVEKVAFKELKRMSRMSPGAAEYTVSRTYIDWLVELPWKHPRTTFWISRWRLIFWMRTIMVSRR